MHELSEFNILAECEHGYIGECSCCHGFNFAYKNVLLCFQEDEMVRFLEWLTACKFNLENYLPLPHGRDRVYRSPLDNLYLAYTLSELEEIEQLFSEVQLVLEARRILGN